MPCLRSFLFTQITYFSLGFLVFFFPLYLLGSSILLGMISYEKSSGRSETQNKFFTSLKID
nr:MAG TPA: hypothetical protein [Caudoviricetes sp.]